MSEVLHINDADFETTVVQSDIPVLVDFWAPWCGPCKMIAPILDEIAPEFAGKAKIVKINVDDNQLVAGQFGVRSIPTLLLFKNGQLVQDVLSYTKEEEDGYKVTIFNPGNAGDTVRVTVTWQLKNLLFFVFLTFL